MLQWLNYWKNDGLFILSYLWERLSDKHTCTCSVYHIYTNISHIQILRSYNSIKGFKLIFPEGPVRFKDVFGSQDAGYGDFMTGVTHCLYCYTFPAGVKM
jgi:hypothetical protein